MFDFELRLFSEIPGILIAAKEGRDWLFKYFVCFFCVCLEIEKIKARVNQGDLFDTNLKE